MSFSQDWFSQHIPIWTRLLQEFKGRAGLRVLEIGTFEGRSTCWLLENIITGEGAHIDCIDTFEGAEDMVALKLDMSNMRDLFESNIAPWRDRVSVYAGESATVLRGLSGPFDLVYVDGSHRAADVLADAVLSWPLLKDGGIMLFDDYLWQQDPRPEHCPRLGIDSFLRCQRGWFDVLLAQYQVAVRKRAEYVQPEQSSADADKKQGGSTRDAKIVYAGPKFTFRR
jgi:predicted O-methyltransferase YrrM